ncbi:NAD(P)H-hydrate dehydratase [Piscinibacter sp. HJYY11]|uniref:NAD(P)H-hydrate dehydratase n=1 Tax=Piscinibacter sp. HJYY11 TaxID=2801333 RepID=UPI00191F4CBE|nr:NAD(P)H-hydrate dehydratase [Piscinibacter sp. HJYY11]MBL0726765.1 NAD(P)H-hydrate dehydratase [Piscinibacter sp. HJYY11]
MQRILPAQHDWPLHDVAASRLMEQQAQAGLPTHTLMQRAGMAVAALTRALHPHARKVWIACGPGNNGGDGLDAAIHLRAAGWSVELSLLCDPARLPADAADAHARARSAGVAIGGNPHPTHAPDVAIDAVLGLGGRRGPTGELAALIDNLNALDCPVLAVDLPSGLNADTGQPHGKACVVADHTLSLLTLKPGLFTGAGRDHSGEVWFDPLEVTPQRTSIRLSGSPALHPSRRHAQHKGSFGDVAVVGGAAGMAGAALLAARAAHAAGAGRVYVDVLDSTLTSFDAGRPELMLRHGWSHTASAESATVVAGCGGGAAIRQALPRLLSTAGRLVLDADALNAVAADPALAALLTARSPRQRETVLTPHPLEAARLLGTDTASVQADRVAAARQLSQRFGCVIVLKGSGSVIAGLNGDLWINGTGNAALGSAGTGDVLAGWIGGCWSASGSSALDAARHATWLHGLAAERSQASPLRAADLIDAMHSAAPRR